MACIAAPMLPFLGALREASLPASCDMEFSPAAACQVARDRQACVTVSSARLQPHSPRLFTSAQGEAGEEHKRVRRRGACGSPRPAGPGRTRRKTCQTTGTSVGSPCGLFACSNEHRSTNDALRRDCASPQSRLRGSGRAVRPPPSSPRGSTTENKQAASAHLLPLRPAICTATHSPRAPSEARPPPCAPPSPSRVAPSGSGAPSPSPAAASTQPSPPPGYASCRQGARSARARGRRTRGGESGHWRPAGG